MRRPLIGRLASNRRQRLREHAQLTVEVSATTSGKDAIKQRLPFWTRESLIATFAQRYQRMNRRADRCEPGSADDRIRQRLDERQQARILELACPVEGRDHPNLG